LWNYGPEKINIHFKYFETMGKLKNRNINKEKIIEKEEKRIGKANDNF
jgi:hypothetical protein